LWGALSDDRMGLSFIYAAAVRQLWLYSPGTDLTENASYIIAYTLVTEETQICSIATAVILPPVYTAVTWQWACML
jgi:hypothetical protein